MADLLKGAPVAKRLDEETKKLSEMLISLGVTPTLAVVRVGERDDDLSYEKSILKRAPRCGVNVLLRPLPADASEDALYETVSALSRDASVHGILLFRPLPKYIDDARIRSAIAPEKDVDGVTEGSLAGVFTGAKRGFAPCTAEAVMELLSDYQIPLAGKRVSVVGRSLTVGKPLSMLLLEKNATVTLCHSKTENLPAVTREADVVIAAVGKAEFFKKEFFSPGQTVVDVGIHALDGRLCGDVDFAEAEPIVKALTPVPGGVGAVTTGLLFMHTAKAALNQSAKAE